MLHGDYDQPYAPAVQAQFGQLLDYVGEKLPPVFEHLDRADLRFLHLVPEGLTA